MRVVAAAAIAMLTALPASADTRGFIGFHWTFDSFGSTPEAALGIARVRLDSDGDARGAKASVHLPLSDGLTFGKAKLVGVRGKSDRMIEAGLGWSAETGSVLGTAGLWAPYVDAGLDFDLSGVQGYGGINSLKKWD
ncbi:hypothetical protein SAMN04488075_0735 [Paracoccus alkenifer]|uniref:Porin n=2 Tax=Paracoccus alkenifer TaxID=65735 RepID=A0A1H6JYM3_9RHOB|nr:hypothetical protein SAMN04488075_0735 [Paracoccus alkenifer]